MRIYINAYNGNRHVITINFTLKSRDNEVLMHKADEWESVKREYIRGFLKEVSHRLGVTSNPCLLKIHQSLVTPQLLVVG